MSEITIQVTRPEDWQTIIYGDNFGRVYLDLPADTAISMTKALDRLDEIQQVTQEAALSISLSVTPRNKAILERFRPDAIRQPPNPILIEVRSDGERVPVAAMTVVKNTSQAFEVDLFGDDWIDQLKELKLSDLDLGSIFWDAGTVSDIWAGDRQQIAVPLLAHYGGWFAPGGVVLEDLRFVFNDYLLLQAAFCAIGWQLESQHLSAGNGANQYSYLSPLRWYSYRDKEDVRFVQVNIDPPRAMAGTDDVILFDVVSDPLSLYNTTRPDEYYFGTGVLGFGPFDLIVEVKNLVVTLPPPPANTAAYQFYIIVYKNDNGGSLVFLSNNILTGSVDQTVTRKLDFNVLDENATDGDSYGVIMGYGDLSPVGVRVPYMLESCDVNFRPDFPYYYRGQDVYLADLLDPTITAMQLFTAVAQKFNGKIETDYAARIVRIEAPFAYSEADDGDIIDGFYQRQLRPVDFRDRTVPGSLKWQRVDQERNRF